MNRPAWHLYTGRVYVPAAKTDIRETFKRVRAEHAQQPSTPQVVRRLKRAG